MSAKETYLKDLTTSSGYLANKTVYFNDIVTQKLNGIPLSTLQNEGNDHIAPVDYVSLKRAAESCKTGFQIPTEHDYDYYLKHKTVEDQGLTGQSTTPFLKNSAIGSKAGAVFGNKVEVLSAQSGVSSEITPFTMKSYNVITDEIYSMSEPENKKIKVNSNLDIDGEIGFVGNSAEGKTEISRGRIVASQIGDEDTSMTVEASGIRINSDIEMGDRKKVITSQLEADEYGALDIKADKIHFTANEITFDPDSTEVTTGNFPQIITNLTDYECVQKAAVYTYTDPSLKSDTKNAIFAAFWKLQMFYNMILVKLSFDEASNETEYTEKMKENQVKEVYIHFPSDYYSHFCDYYGKDDNDYYITNTELILRNEEEMKKFNVSVYFNPKLNNFLKLKYYDVNGVLQYWPDNFRGYKYMKVSDINFGLCVTTPRLKKQYQSTTPSTCMKKPDFYETLTPRKKVKVRRAEDSNIYKDNIAQSIKVTEDLTSEYEIQAAVSATKIHRIAFFEVRLSFLNKNTGLPVPFNDALRVLNGYERNQKEFLITFIPSGENRRFACSDQTNTDHIARHPVSNVKFVYNPKGELGLTKGIIDFSEATELQSDDDVCVSIQFYHITEN